MTSRLLVHPCHVVLALVLCSGCVTRAQQFAIEVTRGATLEERLATAKAAVTDQRLARLKEEVKQTLPGVTDAQLAGMRLRWNENHLRSLSTGATSTSVFVLVILEERAGVDAATVVKTAADVLDRELNGAVSNGAVK